jgi:hypothetical protein
MPVCQRRVFREKREEDTSGYRMTGEVRTA